MVLTEELDKKISSSGLKTGYIVDKIGISRQAFDKKRKNKTPFRVSEVYVICDLLELQDDEKERIFYSNGVE